MKKRIWSLLLCLVLVCAGFAGCGSKDEEDAAASAEKVVSSQLQNFSDEITEAIQKVSNTTGTSYGVGADVNVSFAPSEWFRKTSALDGMESIGLFLAADVKEALQMHLNGQLVLNGTGVVAMDIITSSDMVYANLPAYSKSYMGMPMDDATGVDSSGLLDELQEMGESMPDSAALKEMWTEFANGIIESFVYQETVANISFEAGSYKIKGDKYITKADPQAIATVFADLESKLAAYSAFSDLDIDFDAGDVDEVILNYFTNDDGEFAWEFEAVEESQTTSGVLISTKSGFQLSVQDGEQTEVLAYSTKESDTKGTIVLCGSEGDITIQYDNYSESHVDLSLDLYGTPVSCSIDEEEGATNISYEVLLAGVRVYGTLVMKPDDSRTVLTVSVSTLGNEIGTVTVDVQSHSARAFRVPQEYVDEDTWALGLDTDKLMKDLQKLQEDYPFLEELLGDLLS